MLMFPQASCIEVFSHHQSDSSSILLVLEIIFLISLFEEECVVANLLYLLFWFLEIWNQYNYY